MSKTVLIAGLGNVGRQYELTRHNVGFCVVDLLAEKLGCAFSLKKDLHALVAQVSVQGGTLALAKPTDFMNNSGYAVSSLRSWYKLTSADQCFVVTDNTDLPVGAARIKRPKVSPRGGAGSSERSGITHNGIRSLIEHVGKEHFTALYIGIGSAGGRDLASHVLGRWQPNEDAAYGAVFEACASVLERVCVDDFETLSRRLASLLSGIPNPESKSQNPPQHGPKN